MGIRFMVLALITLLLLSFSQDNNTTVQFVSISARKITLLKEKQVTPQIDPQYIDTTYTYHDKKGRKLVIQNSTPKGGLPYYDEADNEYFYYVFWTRITNDSDDALTIQINFPGDALETQGTPDTRFHLIVPSKEKMKPTYVPFFTYGFKDVRELLRKKLGKPSRLQKKIRPRSSAMFYVVTVADRIPKGIQKNGISLKGTALQYIINGNEFACGRLSYKN